MSSFRSINDDSETNEDGGMARGEQSSSECAHRIALDRLYRSVRGPGAGQAQSAPDVATGTNQSKAQPLLDVVRPKGTILRSLSADTAHLAMSIGPLVGMVQHSASVLEASQFSSISVHVHKKILSILMLAHEA